MKKKNFKRYKKFNPEKLTAVNIYRMAITNHAFERYNERVFKNFPVGYESLSTQTKLAVEKCLKYQLRINNINEKITWPCLEDNGRKAQMISLFTKGYLEIVVLKTESSNYVIKTVFQYPKNEIGKRAYNKKIKERKEVSKKRTEAFYASIAS